MTTHPSRKIDLSWKERPTEVETFGFATCVSLQRSPPVSNSHPCIQTPPNLTLESTPVISAFKQNQTFGETLCCERQGAEAAWRAREAGHAGVAHSCSSSAPWRGFLWGRMSSVKCTRLRVFTPVFGDRVLFLPYQPQKLEKVANSLILVVHV